MLRRTLLVALTLSLSLAAGSARAAFENLVKKTPSNANMLVMVNADAIYQSPIGRFEGWQAAPQKGLEIGGQQLPAGVHQMLISANLAAASMQPVSETALFATSNTPDWQTLAERFQGTTASIAGFDGVHIPGKAYVMGLKNNVVESFAPADREQVAKLLAAKSGAVGVLSDYLRTAAGYAENQYSQIVVAFDAKHSISPEIARGWLNGADGLLSQNISVDPDSLADNLASLKGVTLGVAIGDQMNGKIRIDFNSPPSELEPLAKQVFIGLMSERGAMIDDFAQWKTSVQGNSIFLEGPLSADGLRQLLSLVQLPGDSSPAESSPAEKPAPAPVLTENKVQFASQNYFKSVMTLLDNLGQRENEAVSYGQGALLYDTYAQKIDRLPILNVDGDLQSYGANLSKELRNLSLTIKGGTIQANNDALHITAVANVEVDTSQDCYPDGPVSVSSSTAYELRNVAAEQRAVRSQAISTAYGGVQQMLAQIQQETAQTRNAMTNKYQVEF